MGKFDGKVVIVTGASSGIGEELARRYWSEGASIAVCSRTLARIEKAVSGYTTLDDPRVLAMAADMTKLSDIEAFVAATVAKFGRVDILINNAGLSHPKPTVEVSEEDFDITVDTKLKGFFFMCREVSRDMLRRSEGGAIVNIGSVQSATVLPGQAVYSSSNAGIVQMTRSFGREWGKAGIRVNCIAPGSIQTPENAAKYADPEVNRAMCEKIPLGYRGFVHQISDAAFFLTAEESAYITGQTLFVDGGLSLVQG